VTVGRARFLALLGALVAGVALASSSVHATARYHARIDGLALVLETPGQRELVRWPLGATVTPTDPGAALTPAPVLPAVVPVASVQDGSPALTWTWSFATGPIARQVETLRFRAERVDYRVSVEWRGTPPRFVRMSYGARLTGGAWDLEGLWETSGKTPPAQATSWLPAPVPGVFVDTGTFYFRKRLELPAARASNLELVLTGIDDGDVTSLGGVQVGSTPSDPAAGSWTTVRRYTVSPSVVSSGGAATLEVANSNLAGPGGIWRGPCVLGEPAALAAAPDGAGWTRAVAPGKTIFHWCPDAFERPLQGRFTVSLTCQDRTALQVPENVTSGGRYLLPPYVVAIDGTNGFWGIGTLEVPRAEDGLRVEWRDGTLSCPFLLDVAETAAGSWTNGPWISLITGSSRSSVLATYLDAIPRLASGARQDWWSGPDYDTWGDQVYTDPGAPGAAMDAANVDRWLGALDAAHMKTPLVTLDANWWKLSRADIQGIRASGKRVAIWSQPHWGTISDPRYQAHPDWLVREMSGGPWHYDADTGVVDYTNVDARGHALADLTNNVSSTGWDMDGIKLDFNYVTAPLWTDVTDRSWGAGEAYRARVLAEVRDALKAVKPHMLLTASCANPLFGDVEDLCRLNDDLTFDPEQYRRRAQAVIELGRWCDSDDWNALEADLPLQAVERPVWGCFTIESALSRGDARNQPIPLSAEWKKRLSAIFELATHAPVKAGQRCAFDPALRVARRVNKDGSVAVEALALEGVAKGNQVLVVRDGDELLVTSIASGHVKISVPRKMRVSSVEAVRHDGTRVSVSANVGGGKVLLDVEDAAGAVGHYEVKLVR
jgi:hypothetical protein